VRVERTLVEDLSDGQCDGIMKVYLMETEKGGLRLMAWKDCGYGCGQKVKPWDGFVDRGEVLVLLRRRRGPYER
jgi:hypothetical protein